MPWLIGGAILAIGGVAVYVYEHHIKPGHKIPPPGVIDSQTAKEVNKAVAALGGGKKLTIIGAGAAGAKNPGATPPAGG